MYRMNEIVTMIRRSGSATVVLKGETLVIGFQGQGQPGTLIMLGGGYYRVTMNEGPHQGRTFPVAKGELVTVVFP